MRSYRYTPRTETDDALVSAEIDALLAGCPVGMGALDVITDAMVRRAASHAATLELMDAA